MLAEGWWDYTTLDENILQDAAHLSEKDLLGLSRPGFEVVFYETLESFYMNEALEYINTWKRATSSRPAGICGPIGPTEQLPLVAELVNSLEMSLKHCHFWGMDEWVDDQGVPMPITTSGRDVSTGTTSSGSGPVSMSSSADPRAAWMAMDE